MSRLVSLYLTARQLISTYLEEERGDAVTSFIIMSLIVVVMGVFVIGSMRIFVPDIMTTITTRITTLFNP